jgi:hypothetical protein
MSKRWILAGSVDQTIDIFVPDSSSPVGAGLSGLVYNTANLACYYRKGTTGAATQLALATLATIGTAHSDGGFKEVEATNMKGVYRLDLSDTMVATAGMLTIYLFGAANMAPVVLEIEVVAVNIFDAMRLGLSALPNVSAGAVGGLPLVTTSVLRVSYASGPTLYGLMHTTAGLVWRGGANAFVAFASNWTEYATAITFTETSSSGNYVAAMSGALAAAITDGKYLMDVRRRVSGSAAITDTRLGVYEVEVKAGAFVGLRYLGGETNALNNIAASQVWQELHTGPQIVYSFGELLATMLDNTISSRALPGALKKNTSFNNFCFVMTDSTNHAPVTGKTVTATRSLDGAGFAACANAVTELANGVYKINLAAGDVNGNMVVLRFTATGCDDLLLPIIPQP